jgi:hypothetical protein
MKFLAKYKQDKSFNHGLKFEEISESKPKKGKITDIARSPPSKELSAKILKKLH